MEEVDLLLAFCFLVTLNNYSESKMFKINVNNTSKYFNFVVKIFPAKNTFVHIKSNESTVGCIFSV